MDANKGGCSFDFISCQLGRTNQFRKKMRSKGNFLLIKFLVEQNQQTKHAKEEIGREIR
jgi:hypothetical protein